MTTDILIVSYKRDFRYLKYCLRSIVKFCTGFEACKVMVPYPNVDECRKLLDGWQVGTFPIEYEGFDEWPNLGMVHHMHLIMNSDTLCQGDFVLHTDSDCVFTKPITPESFMVDGKPILYHATFRWLISQQANLSCWQEAVERALGWKPVREFMRRHPAVHYRDVYAKTRKIIEEHHKCSMEWFMKQQRNSFPQSFAEFPTLGEVAWKCFHDQYYWIDQEKNEVDKSHIYQAWSHREPTEDDLKIYKELGIA